MFGIIYKTTNNIDGKIYIGKAQNSCKSTIRNEYLGSGVFLRRAIKKYGKENFYKEIIDTAANKKDLNDKEIYWIDYYNSRNQDIGYNITAGGEGSDYWKGKKFSDSHRKKISDAFSGENNPFYGKHLSAEHKEKLRIVNLGSKRPPRSEEYRKKLSESRKGIYNPNSNYRKRLRSQEEAVS